MKIETKDQTWKPIVVTIETFEEARELFEHMEWSPEPVKLLVDLYDTLAGRTE